jgi:DNA-binding NtrC family response regulator
MRILLVEDSCQVGVALKDLLQMFGADVAGPVATTAEAERLISVHAPDVALVDVNLRGGEQAYDLIDKLHAQGVPVIVTSGYADLPLASQKVVAILEKPLSEELLLSTLRPLNAQRPAP